MTFVLRPEVVKAKADGDVYRALALAHQHLPSELAKLMQGTETHAA